MKKCNDKRDTCGTIVSSSCVPYTGEIPSIIDEDNLPCIPNINDVILEMSDVIKEIKDYTSLTGINTLCLDDCNCDEDNSHLIILQGILTKLCDLIDRVKALEEANVLATKFNINLSCFNSPCINNSSNEHSLLDIISLFASELCILKNQ